MDKILLVTDLDGTLLNRKQQISEENQRAIEAFKLAGGLFTIATGRMEDAVQSFMTDLSLDLPMILYNGAKIIDPIDKKVLFERNFQVPMSLWEKLIQIGEQEAAVLIYADANVYTFTKNDIVVAYRFYKRENRRF